MTDGATNHVRSSLALMLGCTFSARQRSHIGTCCLLIANRYLLTYTALNFYATDADVLLELRVENYAVIDNVAVEFASGLNLLTGETGAGKSILIDALALLFGEKASADVVRHGAEKAVVAAVFDAPAKLVAPILEANGLDPEGAELILRREIAAGGKGRVFVNNQPATVAVLKQLAPLLGAIHAQSESILSFDAHERLLLLDRYADLEVEPVAEAFAKWNGIRSRIADLQRDEQDRLRLVHLWSVQKKEIEQGRLAPGEAEKPEGQKR